MTPPSERVSASGLALSLDQGRRDRLLRSLAGPEDELEDRVEALAFLDRRLDQGLGVAEGEGAALVAFEQGRVAEEDEAAVRPQLEMAEPELLVDQPDRLVDRGALVAGDADVGQRQELEDVVLVAPDRAQLVLRPAALEVGDDLFFAIALVRPVVRAEIMFEHVDRRAGLALELELIDVHLRSPAHFCSRANLPCALVKRKARAANHTD